MLDDPKVILNNIKKFHHEQDSVKQFIDNNRGVSFSNYFIKLLKKEKSSIDSKGIEVANVLRESELHLDQDYKKFMFLQEKEADDKRRRDEEQLKRGIYGKELFERQKRLMQENKVLSDDVQKSMRNILTLKYMTTFTNLALSKGAHIEDSKFSALLNTDEITEFENQVQVTELDTLVSYLITDFTKNQASYNKNSNLLDDPETLVVEFQILEGKIIKRMEELEKKKKNQIEVIEKDAKNMDDLKIKEENFNKETEIAYHEKQVLL